MQNILSYNLLSKNIMVKIYRTVILPVVSYGSEAWSCTLWEEHRPTMFENSVLRNIFGSKWDEEQRSVEGYVTRNLKKSTRHQILFRQIRENAFGGACSTYGGEKKWIQNLVEET